MTFDRAVEQFLKRDRLVVLAGLIGVTLLAWAYLAAVAAGMTPAETMSGMAGMEGMGDMGQLRPWTASDAWMTFSMWAVMMAGMMTPSATPVILLYARVLRRRSDQRVPFAPTGIFFLGYIAVWAVFSAGATALQWGLEQGALLSPLLVSVSPVLSGIFLMAAGVYQWLPTKGVCLRHCRSPVEWLSRRWQAGAWGAFRMGIEHGGYCLGCCWALMLLLFVGGIMNLLWLAALAALILAEKVTPFGRAIGQVGGAALVVAGVVSIF